VSFPDVEQVRIDLPATYKSLSILGVCIAEMLARIEGPAVQEKIVYSLQLAAHEVCANIVEHAYGERSGSRIGITLTVMYEPRQFVIDLHDHGSAFDIDSIAEPNLEEAHDHGYGMFLVRSLVDHVTYTPLPASNHWRLTKQL
jgi:serine/threonine-protein kinase RsbW